jgi:PKD repeat protein
LTATNSAGSKSITKGNKYLIVGTGSAYNTSNNEITWLGDTYWVGDWQMPIGTFKDDVRNVWVDANNRMHCDLKKWSNVWTCAEAQMEQSYTYGIFRWTVESDRMGNVDSNVDMGTFTYEDMPEGHYNELDFEISTWGASEPNMMMNTVQPGMSFPGGQAANEHRVQPFLAPISAQPMVWQVDWQASRIIFSMWYANGSLCDSWTYTDTHYIPTTAAFADMMVWAMAAPTDGQPETLIIDNLQISQSAPVTDFYANVTSGDAPLTVQFTDTSTNIPTSYSWNFGDGTTSTLQNPTHTYNSAGNYSVNLTATNYYGSNTSRKTAYIVVNTNNSSNPSGNSTVASFRTSAYSIKKNNPITLYDTSSGSPTSWAWTVKNSIGTTVATNSSKNFTWTPTSEGIYDVSLTAINDVGSNTITKSKLIKVGSGIAKNSTGDSTNGYSINWLGNEYIVSNWGNFGNDSVWIDANNSLHLDTKKINNVWTSGEVSQASSYTYGTYIWTVESSRLGNVDPNLVMSTVLYGDETHALATQISRWGDSGISNKVDFGVQPTTITGNANTQDLTVPAGSQPMTFIMDWQPTRIIYKLSYLNGTVANTWNYSNVSGIPSTALIPIMDCWINSGTGPSDNINETFQIDDFSIIQALPVTDFYANATSGISTLAVQFTDTSTNIPTSYSWNFGDGTTSTLQNPTHTYNSAGNYSVNLTASNYYGSKSINKTAYIVVYPQTLTPIANFTSNVTSGVYPTNVLFTDTSTNSPTSWAWDFNNDGSVDSTLQNPVYNYTSIGTYTVKLTATNLAGSDYEIKTNYISITSTSPETPAEWFWYIISFRWW